MQTIWIAKCFLKIEKSYNLFYYVSFINKYALINFIWLICKVQLLYTKKKPHTIRTFLAFAPKHYTLIPIQKDGLQALESTEVQAQRLNVVILELVRGACKVDVGVREAARTIPLCQLRAFLRTFQNKKCCFLWRHHPRIDLEWSRPVHRFWMVFYVLKLPVLVRPCRKFEQSTLRGCIKLRLCEQSKRGQLWFITRF